ncbi:endonuclease III [Alsobacter sp. R-9]
MPARKTPSRRLEAAPGAAPSRRKAGVNAKAAAPAGTAKAAAAGGKRKTRAPKPLEAPLVAELFARFREANPEPKGELEHVNPFTLLVAVVLSAQATDAGVNKATRPLFALVDTPQKMLDLGEDRLRDAIKTIGLFRNKAKNVIALSKRLVEEFGGEVPQDRAVLETLPGVGRKTANVVLNMAFGQETIAVDTHLFRVSNRIPLAPGKTPLAVELGLERIVPAPYRLHAHHWLILHGRYVCKARKPECWRCIVSDLCRFEPKSTPGKPVKGTEDAAEA